MSLSAEEKAQYDRQLRVWGHEAQTRMRASHILVVGCRSLSSEICKTIVLAGVGSVTLLDNSIVEQKDLQANFLLAPTSKGQKRADGVRPQLSELNPNVNIFVQHTPLESLDEKFFDNFNAVCVTDQNFSLLIKINKICREKKIPFFSAQGFGFYAYFFEDLVDHQYIQVKKVNDESESGGGGGGDKEKVKEIQEIKISSFVSLENSLNRKMDDIVKVFKRNKEELLIFIFIQSLILFMDSFNKYPDVNNSNEWENLQKIYFDRFDNNNINALISIKDSSIIEQFKLFARQAPAEYIPVSSIVGGVLGQEILKVVGGRDSPLANWFIYSAQSGVGFNKSI